MLVENTIFGMLSKPEISIELLREFEPMALQLHPDGYYLAYSGGKDSDTILELCLEAGVKFTAHYNITTVDPPEVIKHVKDTKKRLDKKGIKLYMEVPAKFRTGKYKGQVKTMWKLIEHKGMPPTRLVRYCCDDFKEHGGDGRLVLTGVRWAESTKRKSRKPLEVVTKKKSDKKLFNDNDIERRSFENCMQKGKRVINPIINWEDSDVWEYLKYRKVKYCKKYDEGEKRLGCIGCPQGGTNVMIEDFERYPHFKKLYIKAFDNMVQLLIEKNPDKERTWKNGKDVFDWWVYSDVKCQKEFDEQISIDDID